MHNHLILSLFPGIDLLGRAFEEFEFCVVRGPDLITGGDIRRFHPPEKRFQGVVGGSPCQDFSALNRNPSTYSHEMLEEYCRCVFETKADWFLFENVSGFPSFEVEGYTQQRFSLDLGWFTEFSRRRDFVFGSLSGQLLNPVYGKQSGIRGTAVTGSDERPFTACCDIQGLPPDFDVPFFSLEGKKQAVANGVPMALGRYVAGLISETFYGVKGSEAPATSPRRCRCGCGRVVVGRAFYHGTACRKRAQRVREAS